MTLVERLRALAESHKTTPEDYYGGQFWDYDDLKLLADSANRIEQLERELAEARRKYAEEVDEFNSGFEAYKNGVSYEDLHDGPHDQVGCGYAWAAFDDLRRELAEARKEQMQWAASIPLETPARQITMKPGEHVYVCRDGLWLHIPLSTQPERRDDGRETVG